METQSGQFLTPGAPENTKGTLGINVGLVFGGDDVAEGTETGAGCSRQKNVVMGCDLMVASLHFLLFWCSMILPAWPKST